MRPAGGERIGVLGGTFDPVHEGHLAMARAAERAAGLERVYFVPAPRPWHRQPPQAGYADRFAMLALALVGAPRWLPLAVPDRPRRPTYAIDQLAWMAEHKGVGRVHLILGADAFATLPTWRQYRRLLHGFDFIVLARRGAPGPLMSRALPAALVEARDARGADLAGGHRLHWVSGFAARPEATRLRAALARGRRPEGMPAAVAEYALRAGLYRRAGGDA
jgi:nicotinate-nucleotide adenylyltransferase